ncbi:MAG: DUF3341 domain-containing protein [Sandaracinaceae bacterium]|nr:DUF3341 domain-containing protein [Sandaracinaceae bacterium]
MQARLRLGVFDDEEALVRGVHAARAAGLPIRDAYTPYPIHGLEEALGMERSWLPWVTFGGGAFGLSLALFVQWWTHSVGWALDVGGKPFDAWPAYAPVAFELMVLIAGLSTAAAFFLASRLKPTPKVQLATAGVTDDVFVLAIEERDGSFDRPRVEKLLRDAGASEVRDGGYR